MGSSRHSQAIVKSLDKAKAENLVGDHVGETPRFRSQSIQLFTV